MEARHYIHAPCRAQCKTLTNLVILIEGLKLDFDPTHLLVQPIGKFVDKALLEARLCPVVENETQVGKPAFLQEQKPVDVVFMPTQRAGEVVGVAGHPVFQAFEQRLADFLEAFRAAGFFEGPSASGRAGPRWKPISMCTT